MQPHDRNRLAIRGDLFQTRILGDPILPVPANDRRDRQNDRDLAAALATHALSSNPEDFSAVEGFIARQVPTSVAEPRAQASGLSP